MPKKRVSWSDQDVDYHDVDKYFEFYDLSLRQYYTDLVEAILAPKNIEGKVLDLGCGFGILGMRLCSMDEFSTVIGLEKSRTLVRTAEVITSRHGYNGRITPKAWPDDNLPFPDGEFDAVVSFLSLHKWNDPQKVFAEIERVRKKGSIVYVSDFRRDQPSIPFQLFVQQVRFEMGKEIAADLRKSYRSAYTANEIKQMPGVLDRTGYRLEESKLFLNIISGLPEQSQPKAQPAEPEQNSPTES
jgi:ubiquinone/menaquinone biosynthesis C-methylase UbiE